MTQLWEAAEAAILAGGGFGWLEVPPRNAMELHRRRQGTHLKGRLLSSTPALPDRGGRDGHIGGVGVLFAIR